MVLNNYPFDRRIGDTNLCVGVDEKEGLWLVKNGRKTRLVKGPYDSPVVTRNQKWIIATKDDSERPIWKSIVRIDTKTKKEYRVNIPKATCLYPSTSLPGLDQVLIVRCKAAYTSKENDPSPDPPEYYILDPASGDTRKVTSEIRPIMHQQNRYLQPSTVDGQYWAAIPNKNTGSTEVGLFDPNNLSFKHVMYIPSIQFYSNDLWVDEDSAVLYLVYEFELLQIPLVR